jgi:hypothetical protein
MAPALFNFNHEELTSEPVQRDSTSAPLLATASVAGVDWMSLLDAIGTEQFDPALKRFLASHVEEGGCVAFFNQTPCRCRHRL